MLSLNHVRVIFRNFSGAQTQYNRSGDINFCVNLSDNLDLANDLLKEGWNVKIKPAKDEESSDFAYLQVKVKFGFKPPVIYLDREGLAVEPLKIDEDNISMLDDIDIVDIDIDIVPYDWEVGDKRGRAAYLKGMYVRQNVNRFEQRYVNRVNSLKSTESSETWKNVETKLAEDLDLPF